MRCEWLRMPDGTVAIVCHSGRRRQRCSVKRCTHPAERLCDYPIGRGRTCSKPLCSSCAVRQGRNRDHCPDHPEQQRMLPMELPATPL